MRTLHPLHALLALGLVAASASASSARYCHDLPGIAQQNDLRRGLHSLNDGRGNQSIWGDPPTVGGTRGGGANGGVGGLGQMRGNSVGAYGAGSVGELGPGGLGSMRNGGLGPPPAPSRPR